MAGDLQPAPSITPGERCSTCGSEIPAIGIYCPNCGAVKPSLRIMPSAYGQQMPGTYGGAYQPRKPSRSIRTAVKGVMAYMMLSLVAQLVVSLAVLVWGVHIVLPEIVHHSYPLYIITPFVLTLVSVGGGALGAYYVMLVVAILASAAWLFLTSRKKYLSELSMNARPRDHSALFDVAGLTFAILFLNAVIVLFMAVADSSPIDPVSSVDLWELLFLLANASVWEEIIVRVLLIGLPMIVIDVARGGLRPKKHTYILGGGFTLGAPEVILVLLSSAIFGLAHLDSWGTWKVFPASVAGVAFGYLFLRHGLASAIMLHFAFDYMSIPMQAFPDNFTLQMMTGLAVLLWLGLGLVFFVYYITRMIEFVTRRTYFDGRPEPIAAPMFRPYYVQPTAAGQYQAQPPPPPPPPEPAMMRGDPGVVGWAYVCPSCGNTEARWEDGKWRCLRCGSFS